MEYTEHLLNPRSVVVPVLALAIGAGGAVGIYAALDDPDIAIEPATRVVVTEPPAKAGEGVAAKDEAATAAAVGRAEFRRPGGGPPAESRQSEEAETARRTDPHGPASATP
jgi:hypothetical protein